MARGRKRREPVDEHIEVVEPVVEDPAEIVPISDHPVEPTPEPERQISNEAQLIRGVFRMAGLAVGTAVRTGQWAVESTLEVGKQVVEGAVGGESPAELADRVGTTLRTVARDALGVDNGVDPDRQPVREVVSYVPVATPVPVIDATLAELRRRGDELLALSADVYYADDTHPAYDAVLGQLAPDEARILRFLALHGAQPIVDVRTNRPLGIGSELVADDLTSVPIQAGVRHGTRSRLYLINLKRLGLVQVSTDPVLLSRYMVLEVQPVVDEALQRAGRAPKIVRKSLQLTEFGSDFCRTCFTLPE